MLTINCAAVNTGKFDIVFFEQVGHGVQDIDVPREHNDLVRVNKLLHQQVESRAHLGHTDDTPQLREVRPQRMEPFHPARCQDRLNLVFQFRFRFTLIPRYRRGFHGDSTDPNFGKGRQHL